MSLDDLARELRGDLHRPGSEGYARTTTPFNATIEQHPVAVVSVAGADDVAAAIGAARAAGLHVVPQSSGHGALALGEDVLLLDTTALSSVQVDPGSARAVVGAGATWAAIQGEAERHGLLGLAGTSPTVAVTGYTFGGGVGWLTRPYGTASAHLHAVDVVDGAGTVRRLDDAASDPVDVEALWACRGGGGVGIATSLEIGLVPATDVWVGNLVWRADRTADVARAWAEATRGLPTSLTSVVGIGLAPPSPAVPEELHGGALVRVIGVSTAGENPWHELRAALVEVADPVLDESGAADAARLGSVHLDPPVPAAGAGEGRWLDASAGDLVADALTVHGTGADLPLLGIEVRHVGTDAGASTDGAFTRLPGPYLVHAIGRAGDPETRARTEQAAHAANAVLEPAWIRRAASFCSNLGPVDDALEPEVRARVLAAHDATDPDGVLARPAVAR